MKCISITLRKLTSHCIFTDLNFNPVSSQVAVLSLHQKKVHFISSFSLAVLQDTRSWVGGMRALFHGHGCWQNEGLIPWVLAKWGPYSMGVGKMRALFHGCWQNEGLIPWVLAKWGPHSMGVSKMRALFHGWHELNCKEQETHSMLQNVLTDLFIFN